MTAERPNIDADCILKKPFGLDALIDAFHAAA